MLVKTIRYIKNYLCLITVFFTLLIIKDELIDIPFATCVFLTIFAESIIIDLIVNKKIKNGLCGSLLKLCPVFSAIVWYLLSRITHLTDDSSNYMFCYSIFAVIFINTLPFFFISFSKDCFKEKLITALLSYIPIPLLYMYLLTQTWNVFMGIGAIFLYLLQYFLVIFSVVSLQKKIPFALILALINAVLLFLLQVDRSGSGGWISFSWDWLIVLFVIFISILNFILSSIYILIAIYKSSKNGIL